jgi:hypothetical protein
MYDSKVSRVQAPHACENPPPRSGLSSARGSCFLLRRRHDDGGDISADGGDRRRHSDDHRVRGHDEETDPTTDGVVTGFAGSWLPEDVEGIELTEANTIPVIDAALADERVSPDHWVWDWWPVRDRDGEVADIDGWNIAIALAAPADILPGKRHDVATHRYLLSDDGGRTWTDGGELFPGELLGTRQWAGSAMFDEETDTLYAFYTAAGDDDGSRRGRGDGDEATGPRRRRPTQRRRPTRTTPKIDRPRRVAPSATTSRTVSASPLRPPPSR